MAWVGLAVAGTTYLESGGLKELDVAHADLVRRDDDVVRAPILPTDAFPSRCQESGIRIQGWTDIGSVGSPPPPLRTEG